MKKIIALALMTVLITGSTHADDWTGQDKTGHATHSMAFGIAAASVVNQSGNWNWKASGLCMVPGLAKEFHDSWAKEGSGFSYKDLAADAVGCVAGIAITQQTVVRFMHRNDKTSVQINFKF